MANDPARKFALFAEALDSSLTNNRTSDVALLLKYTDFDRNDSIYAGFLSAMAAKAALQGNKDAVDLLLEYAREREQAATWALTVMFNAASPASKLDLDMGRHLVEKGANPDVASAVREEELKQQIRETGKHLTALRASKRELNDGRCATIQPVAACASCSCERQPKNFP